MDAIGGYKGKLLYVDLSKRTFETRDLKEQDARMFLGGSGLGSKILFDEMDLMLDPYYDIRGWDQNGIPTAGKLRELSLEGLL